MPKYVRSARGELVDFELLAIKAQLAAAPVPKKVEERKAAIAEKDGEKADVKPDLDIMEIAKQAAAASAGQARQLKRK
jgi:hypothetical protein